MPSRFQFLHRIASEQTSENIQPHYGIEQIFVAKIVRITIRNEFSTSAKIPVSGSSVQVASFHCAIAIIYAGETATLPNGPSSSMSTRTVNSHFHGHGFTNPLLLRGRRRGRSHENLYVDFSCQFFNVVPAMYLQNLSIRRKFRIKFYKTLSHEEFMPNGGGGRRGGGK